MVYRLFRGALGHITPDLSKSNEPKAPEKQWSAGKESRAIPQSNDQHSFWSENKEKYKVWGNGTHVRQVIMTWEKLINCVKVVVSGMKMNLHGWLSWLPPQTLVSGKIFQLLKANHLILFVKYMIFKIDGIIIDINYYVANIMPAINLY